MFFNAFEKQSSIIGHRSLIIVHVRAHARAVHVRVPLADSSVFANGFEKKYTTTTTTTTNDDGDDDDDDETKHLISMP